MSRSEETCMAMLFSCWLVAFWTLILASGSMGVNYYNRFSTYQAAGGSSLNGLYELGRDWQVGPFLDLDVSSIEHGC